ncbi:hypothetical protein [Duncaniella dubosii]
MRKFKFLSMAAIAAMMLGACSDDKSARRTYTEWSRKLKLKDGCIHY